MSMPVSILSATKVHYPSRPAPTHHLDLSRVGTIILGGGQGTRLFPLTHSKCKPAISIGGNHMMIDVALSNAIHSGCKQIYIITQFLSKSLHKHICHTYQGGGVFQNGFIDLLTAEQRPTPSQWFQGTADAVRQNLHYLKEAAAEYFLILSGDQLYRYDFRHLFAKAIETNADAVISVLPVKEAEAKRMGLMRLNERGAVSDFYEKPQDPEILKKFRCEPPMTDLSRDHYYLGSMGIYLFKRSVLFDLLQNDNREDFGKHILPSLIQRGNVFTHSHQGYWEDIGTIKSFYEANISLTQPHPTFQLHDEMQPIFAANSRLSPPKIIDAQISHSILCDGSYCEAQEISNSIIGPRSVIRKGVIIRGSYLMGNDSYTPPVADENLPSRYEIGEDSYIERCIIDKQASIGRGVRLANKDGLETYDNAKDGVFIRDGIVIVSRGAVIPDGYSL